MNTQIKNYVAQMEAQLMADMTEAKEANLYEIASLMIADEDMTQFANVCQAYEVVKHHLVG
ncbi:MAG TPA: hypothetical protein K8V30_07930 [Metalysinibacillus jejuensis]|uniref:Uncharacterized protein n=1 Tax=Metalysinibacillus jejuensis TaxID=914327 RepID=A0A921NBV1_9BACL|nr:hypothetical protein [Metalysinibacillus jejuensis]